MNTGRRKPDIRGLSFVSSAARADYEERQSCLGGVRHRTRTSGRRLPHAQAGRHARRGDVARGHLPTATTAEEAHQSFLYGRITTVDGVTYEGRLRWGGDEEAFGRLLQRLQEREPLGRPRAARAAAKGAPPD